MEPADPPPGIPPQTLTDGVVTLRPWKCGDAVRLFEAARESIATVSPWLPWLGERYGIADAEAWANSSDSHWHGGLDYRFAVFEADARGRLLGGAGLNQINRPHQVGNLGYWVRASASPKRSARRSRACCATDCWCEARGSRPGCTPWCARTCRGRWHDGTHPLRHSLRGLGPNPSWCKVDGTTLQGAI